MKEPRLITLAQQGNEKAIATLLNRFLAHKQVTVSVRSQLDFLDIKVQSTGNCDRETILILCDRALMKMQLSYPEIRLSAPDWQVLFSPGDYTYKSSTVTPAKTTVKPSQSFLKLSQVCLAIPPRDRQAYQILVAGLLGAILLMSFPPIYFILSYLPTIIHELGHAVFGWLFGYPSLPSFDFVNGGGITLRGNQSFVIILGVYFAISSFLYFYHRNRLTLKISLVITAIYTVCLLTNWHTILIIFMGHGCELLFASIFGYRALSGAACRHQLEQFLYAILSFFIFLTNLELAWLVIFNPQMRSLYEMGKGGIVDSDFVRLARDYLGINLIVMMAIFALFCCLSMIATWGVYRYRHIWQSGLWRLLERETR
ncbi:MAG: hypothetical protein SAJ12_22505 [Jaaginema sp. PMC 1079.18]|nr:hypothetical protein [Jaaginema sp. PMC 1080.18]MEC4853761.1 hypothetical protein [Jaaginema sp. PMC 1079.18]MEC4864917.1 hypothetical protein [Jaaginema sp. PMC 1078.18]